MKIDNFGTEANLTGEIVHGCFVKQEFTASYNKLESVSVCFATYQRRNRGFVVLEVRDEDGFVISSDAVRCCDLHDNEHHEFALLADLVVGKLYTIVIRSNGSFHGNSVTAKWGKKRHSKNGCLYIGGEQKFGELACSLGYTGTKMDYSEVFTPVVSGDYVLGLVSIVVPCFNNSEYLSDCFDSINFQTYNCLEVIVVDDGSKDVSAVSDLVSEFKKSSDIPLKFITHGENLGANASRNSGYYHSRGEFILFLDSDCRLYKDSIRQYVQALHDNPEASYSYCNFYLGKTSRVFRHFDPEELILRNYICTMSMIRKCHFTGFDETVFRLQDWDLWRTMLRYGRTGVWINNFLFRAEDRPGITKGNSLSFPKAYQMVADKHQFWDKKRGGENDDVTALTVSYRSVSCLKDFYTHFRKYYPDVKLVIVDGSGKHKCADYVRELKEKDDNLYTIMVNYNIGHGYGMHIALSCIQSDYVCIFDSDTKLFKGNLLEEMKKKAGKDFYACGEMIYTDRNGGWSKKWEKIPYVHPAICFLNRHAYFRFRPFQHHGAPCIYSMVDIYDSGRSDELLIEFPVREYVHHEWQGTRGTCGIEPWSRIKRIR